MKRVPKGTPLTQRIKALVSEDAAGCWIFQGRITKCGYGQMSMPGRRKEYAHRVSYRAFVGAIADGLAVDHLCHTKACVNPTHLELVTYGENTRRWWATRKHEAASR